MSLDMHKVVLLETEDRQRGVRATLEALGHNPVVRKNVLLKPNFNTADPAPGSTDNETLTALVEQLWAMGAASITVGDRSYPPTSQVMAEKGIIPLLERLDARVLNFDDLPEKDWVEFKPEGSHWKNGFRVARPVVEAECLVYTGCLKTHQHGGVITLSLKLSVGVVPTTRNGFSYMSELHSSPHQRKMIAEINQPFRPDLVIMDGIDAFVDGGPMTGQRARGNVFFASTDRVAADAVGVAILKHLGSNAKIMETKIFQQEQIARAVELGLGAASPDHIDLEAADEASRDYRDRIQEILSQG